MGIFHLCSYFPLLLEVRCSRLCAVLPTAKGWDLERPVSNSAVLQTASEEALGMTCTPETWFTYHSVVTE